MTPNASVRPQLGRSNPANGSRAQRTAWIPLRASDPAAMLESSHPALHAAIERLGPQHRTAIQMRYFQDATIEEVGRRLGVGPARASQVHRQALERLRSMMGYSL